MLGHRSRLLASALLGFVLTSALVAPTRAAFVADVYESGNDVVAVGSGTIDTAGLTLVFDGNFTTSPFFYASSGAAWFGPGIGYGGSFYTGITGPDHIGDGNSQDGLAATSGSGDIIGVDGAPGILYQQSNGVTLPSGYVSGTFLSATDTWAGQSLSSLDLTPGTYVWTWGDGADADSFTLNIGTQPVPEPSSLAMLGLGALAVAGYARRRNRARA